MNTEQALQASLEITPNVLGATIAMQRQQLADQLRIADGARKLAEESADDCEAWAVAARRVADLRKALDENLEMQAMHSNARIEDADTISLWRKIQERAAAGEKDAIALIKRLSKPKKEPARGAR